MGSGARAERMAYGQVLGEAKAMQEHTLAMIPIMKEQAEMELGIREIGFAQELEQTKKMNLLSQQLQPDPVLIPVGVTATKPKSSDYLIYAGLAALAYFLLRKR